MYILESNGDIKVINLSTGTQLYYLTREQLIRFPNQRSQQDVFEPFVDM